ncbi:AtzH-like domain-containing protein [Gordonia sp. NPDC003376]
MRPPVTLQNSVDSDVLEAFWRYDDALLSDDVAAMGALFEDSAHTLRVDGTRMLVGHQEITEFRSSRAHPATRQILHAHARTIAADTVLIAAVTHAPDRIDLRGYQTQVWQKCGERWVIIAAHLTAPSHTASFATQAAADTSIWRCVGAPLMSATRPGPLSSVGMAVKDVFAVAGFPVGAGNPTWLAEAPVAEESADALAILLASGAHVTGIARTDEFAYSLDGMNHYYGTPPNRAHPDSIPGGSSSGSASAVAAGHAQLGLGSDTAGSIRVPASLQGLFGLRTTHTAISTAGMLPLAPSFDTVGLLAADPDVLVRACGLLVPSASPGAAVATLTVPALNSIAAPEVRSSFHHHVDRLTAQGVFPPVTAVDIDPSTLDSWMRAFRVVQGAEAWKQHGAWITEHPHALSDGVAERFRTAAEVTAEQTAAAHARLTEARSFLTELTRNAYLVLPTSPDGAPRRTSSVRFRSIFRTATLRLTTLASVAGLPAVSIPLLHSGDGKPVGLSVLGAPYADLKLAELAQVSIDEDVRVR